MISFRLLRCWLTAMAIVPAIAAAAQTTLTPTTVLLTIASPATMSYGQSVDGSAQVSASDGSALSGTITFYDGTTNLCVLQVTQTATCPASAGEGFAAGTHNLTAVYSGDATHAPSISNTATVTVLPDTTTATITSSTNPATAGQAITFTATIQGTDATPTGSVTFYDGTAAIGTAALNAAATATLTTSTLATGTHAITAVFGSSGNFAAATSSALSQTIQPATQPTPPSPPTGPAAFTLAISSITIEAGQQVTVLVTVASVNGFSQPVNLSCSNLPQETTCTFAAPTIPSGSGTTMLSLATAAPRDCGTTTPYGSASLPYTTPVAAGLLLLLIPRRYCSLRGLLLAILALGTLASSTGCGTGACTDLGTKPGTYTITVTGTSTGATPSTVSQKVIVKVTI